MRVRARTFTHRESDLWSAFNIALQAASLPVEDLLDPGQTFLALGDGEAFGGYALDAEIARLRSIVVLRQHRRRGLGSAVLAEVLGHARAAGAKEAWLLTTDADAFFGRHGFKPVDRVGAPPAVTASAQFVSLCPTSAVLMCLRPA